MYAPLDSLPPQCRSWERIPALIKSVIHIDMQARLALSVKCRCRLPLRNLRRPSVRHFEVDALWIGLNTLDIPRRMQGNGLMTQHIHPRLQVLGHLERPFEVILDEVVGDPRLEPVRGRRDTALETGLCNLDKLEILLADRGAAARRARSKVVEDGTTWLSGHVNHCNVRLEPALTCT